MRRISILLLVLFTCLTAATAWAGSRIVYVPPPTGTDDTANLQSALDECVGQGQGCTVQLAAGTYLTSQLVTYNFHGTFTGTGQNKTIVEALPNLLVNLPDVLNGVCQPNTTDCRWPDLIIFVDGEITISDMTIRITAVPSTQPWLIFGSPVEGFIDVVRVMGQHRTNASVQSVTMEGALDNSPNSLSGFTVYNAMLYAGELPRSRTPFDYYFLSGTFSVSNSTFKTMYDGPAMDGFMKDSHIVIGGSPSAGNVFATDVPVPLFLCIIENSVVEISHNVGAGVFSSFLLTPWIPSIFAPSKPSVFLIHDNNFQPSGPLAGGIFLQDDPNNPEISALILDNIIEAQDIGSDGIGAYATKGTTIVNNKISGSGTDAIGIWDGAYTAVLHNDVTGFTATSLAQIVLDPATSHSTVVCKTPSDTVMDLGANNKVIDCQETAGSNAMASKIGPWLKVLKKKPFVH